MATLIEMSFKFVLIYLQTSVATSINIIKAKIRMDLYSKRPGLVSWIVFIICISFPYLFLVNKMGIYGDDWNYLGTMFGFNYSKPFHDLCNIDRPNLFYIYNSIGKLLGKSPWHWHLFVYLSLLTLGYITYKLIREIRYFDANISLAIAGIFVLYPCNIMYYSAVTYGLSFIVQNIFFVLSLYLSIRSYKNKNVQLVCLITSGILTLIHEIQLEYFVGLELARILIVYLFLKLRGNTEKPVINYGLFRKAITVSIPNYISTFVFLIWRIFIFHSVRPETDQGKIIKLIISHPLSVFKERLPKAINDLFLGLFGTYFNVFSEELFLTRYKAGFLSMIFILLCVAVLFWGFRKDRNAISEDPIPNGKTRFYLWIILGFVIVAVFSMLPMWFVDKHIRLNDAMSRMGAAIAFPGVFIFLFLISLFIKRNLFKHALWIYLVFCSAFLFRTYLTRGEASWKNIKVYFNQFVWRYPQLPVGTSFMIDGKKIPDANSSPFINFTYGYSKSPGEMNFMFYIWDYKWPKEDSAAIGLHFNVDEAKQIPVSYQPGACIKFGNKNEIFQSGVSEGFKSHLVNRNYAPDTIGNYGNRAKWPSSFLGAEVSKECFCYYFQRAEYFNSLKNYTASVELFNQLISKNKNIELPVALTEWMPFVKSLIIVCGADQTVEKFQGILSPADLMNVKIYSKSIS